MQFFLTYYHACAMVQIGFTKNKNQKYLKNLITDRRLLTESR